MRRRALDPESLDPYLDPLWRVARALTGEGASAHDLVQATCLHALRDPQRVRGDVLVTLVTTLHALFLDPARGKRRRLVNVAAPDPDDVPAIISRLPAEQRDAVALVDVGGLSHGDAARVLGVRESDLASRLYRGRDRIARELADAAGGQERDARGGRAPLA